jgi:hypothetical protein
MLVVAATPIPAGAGGARLGLAAQASAIQQG